MRATPPLALPIGPNRLVALDEAGLDAIHRASLEVLERTWVVVPSARVRVRLTGAARGWATSQGASACPRPARALPAPCPRRSSRRRSPGRPRPTPWPAASPPSPS